MLIARLGPEDMTGSLLLVLPESMVQNPGQEQAFRVDIELNLRLLDRTRAFAHSGLKVLLGISAFQTPLS